jgi:hypothetical protein
MELSSKASEIADKLFGIGVESETRALHILNHLHLAAPKVVRPVFQRAWPCCDNTWQLQDQIVSLLRQSSTISLASSYMSADNKEFYTSLQDEMTIYRGCMAGRELGISWTLDKEVAERFAHGHRGSRVPNPVIAQATISKDNICSVFTSRREAEVVVEPSALKDIQIYPYEHKPKEVQQQTHS